MLNWSAIVAALLSVGGSISMMTGHPALAAIFANPHTAIDATAAVTGVAGLVSAFSGSVHPDWSRRFNPWHPREELHREEERH